MYPFSLGPKGYYVQLIPFHWHEVYKLTGLTQVIIILNKLKRSLFCNFSLSNAIASPPTQLRRFGELLFLSTCIKSSEGCNCVLVPSPPKAGADAIVLFYIDAIAFCNSDSSDNTQLRFAIAIPQLSRQPSGFFLASSFFGGGFSCPELSPQ